MDIRQTVFRSIILLSGARWLQQLLRMASFIILARLLDPLDYGIATLAQVPIGLLSHAATVGMGMVLVSTSAAIERAAPHGVVLTVVGTISLGTFAWVCAPHYANALGHPELTAVCRAMAIMIVFDGLSAVPRAVLSRAMNFQRIAVADIVGTFSDVATAITLAALGYGYWSLVWGLIAGGGFRFLIVAWKRPKHQWLWPVSWDGALARQLGRYGLANTGAVLLWYTHTNGDYVVMGKLYGSVALGFYAQGFRIANLFVEMLHSTLDKVLLSAYVRVRDDKERLARALLSTYRVLMLVLLPTATGLLILAPEVVSVLAGEKWLASVPFLQVFAFQGLVRSIFYQCGLAFDGLNRPHYNLLSALVVVSTMALGIIIVIALGFPALAVAFVVLGGYVAGLTFNLVLFRYQVHLPIHATDLLRHAFPIACAAVAMVLLVSAVKQVLVATSSGALPLLLTLSLTGVVSYGVALFVIKPEAVCEVLDLVLVALGRRARFQGMGSRRAVVALVWQLLARFRTVRGLG
ncbi:MAG: lipopolysaccharide biosynthesis protein [Burkholderiales bacterium]